MKDNAVQYPQADLEAYNEWLKYSDTFKKK
jgi:hypothetical protein